MTLNKTNYTSICIKEKVNLSVIVSLTLYLQYRPDSLSFSLLCFSSHLNLETTKITTMLTTATKDEIWRQISYQNRPSFSFCICCIFWASYFFYFSSLHSYIYFSVEITFTLVQLRFVSFQFEININR